jgi:hypothetical protein
MSVIDKLLANPAAALLIGVGFLFAGIGMSRCGQSFYPQAAAIAACGDVCRHMKRVDDHVCECAP